MLTLTELEEAWADLLANDLDDNALAPGVARFLEGVDEQLTRLETQLADGTYQPQPLTEVEIAKPSGGVRVLHIPAVRDRVVSRALLAAIDSDVDPQLGSCSFAYRAGLGVADAVEAVVSFREEGRRWVLRADIDDCFPTIPVDLVRRRLAALVAPEAMQIADLLLARPTSVPGHRRLRTLSGLAQGCALSPLLSNLLLVDLDDSLLDAGFGVVRYADDVVVGAQTRDDAWEAMR
ncbi:MAG: reverse transcriptase domain-containing protein, partial [Candidatus Phosphoribacter sp.]